MKDAAEEWTIRAQCLPYRNLASRDLKALEAILTVYRLAMLEAENNTSYTVKTRPNWSPPPERDVTKR